MPTMIEVGVASDLGTSAVKIESQTPVANFVTTIAEAGYAGELRA